MTCNSQEVEAFNEARQAITEVMEGSYSRMTDMSFFEEASATLTPQEKEAEEAPAKQSAAKKAPANYILSISIGRASSRPFFCYCLFKTHKPFINDMCNDAEICDYEGNRVTEE